MDLTPNNYVKYVPTDNIFVTYFNNLQMNVYILINILFQIRAWNIVHNRCDTSYGLRW